MLLRNEPVLTVRSAHFSISPHTRFEVRNTLIGSPSFADWHRSLHHPTYLFDFSSGFSMPVHTLLGGWICHAAGKVILIFSLFLGSSPLPQFTLLSTGYWLWREAFIKVVGSYNKPCWSQSNLWKTLDPSNLWKIILQRTASTRSALDQVLDRTTVPIWLS